jgi:hypothetical protein
MSRSQPDNNGCSCTRVDVLEGLTGEEQVEVEGKSGLTEGQAVTVSTYDLPAGQHAQQKM